MHVFGESTRTPHRKVGIKPTPVCIRASRSRWSHQWDLADFCPDLSPLLTVNNCWSEQLSAAAAAGRSWQPSQVSSNPSRTFLYQPEEPQQAEPQQPEEQTCEDQGNLDFHIVSDWIFAGQRNEQTPITGLGGSSGSNRSLHHHCPWISFNDCF